MKTVFVGVLRYPSTVRFKYIEGTYPIGSMYAIYGNIYHQYTPVMLAYIPYMDPMGNAFNCERIMIFREMCFSMNEKCV